jgi:hypothetical protein
LIRTLKISSFFAVDFAPKLVKSRPGMLSGGFNSFWKKKLRKSSAFVCALVHPRSKLEIELISKEKIKAAL